MAETSGPWDGSGFAQDEWRELFSYSQADGLLRLEGENEDGLAATFSPSTRDVTISPGKARVQGNLYSSDEDIVINIPVPSGGNQRIDYIVLRYDPSQVVLNDRIQMVLVEGTEAASPSAPALTQDDGGMWEWPRVRIGPFGSGAISGAPWKYMGSSLMPVVFNSSSDINPNNRLPGLPAIRDTIVIGSDGGIWRYNADFGAYVRVDAASTGTISLSSGYAARTASNTPRWWVKDGLVHLSGDVKRTGGTIQIPVSDPGVKFTNALPSAVRPGRELTLLTTADLAASSGGTDYKEPAVLYYDSDNRLGIRAGFNNNRVDDIDAYLKANSGVIFLNGISWVIS